MTSTPTIITATPTDPALVAALDNHNANKVVAAINTAVAELPAGSDLVDIVGTVYEILGAKLFDLFEDDIIHMVGRIV